MLRIYTYASNVKHDIRKSLARVMRDESGATAIEYGLIAAGIAVAIIGIVFILGNDISAFFAAVDSKLSAKKPT